MGIVTNATLTLVEMAQNALMELMTFYVGAHLVLLDVFVNWTRMNVTCHIPVKTTPSVVSLRTTLSVVVKMVLVLFQPVDATVMIQLIVKKKQRSLQIKLVGPLVYSKNNKSHGHNTHLATKQAA